MIVHLDRIFLLAEPATQVEGSSEDAIDEAKKSRVRVRYYKPCYASITFLPVIVVSSMMKAIGCLPTFDDRKWR